MLGIQYYLNPRNFESRGLLCQSFSWVYLRGHAPAGPFLCCREVLSLGFGMRRFDLSFESGRFPVSTLQLLDSFSIFVLIFAIAWCLGHLFQLAYLIITNIENLMLEIWLEVCSLWTNMWTLMCSELWLRKCRGSTSLSGCSTSVSL